MNEGTSVAPSYDATASPDDDAILASSSAEKGKDNIHSLAGHSEASECITDKEHTVASQDNIHYTSLASPHRAETYWDSPEARKLFRPLTSSEPTVLAAIDNQIKALRHVNKSLNTCVDITGNLEELNEQDDISEHQKRVIQQKAQYLALLLQLAKEKMNAWTWENAVSTQLVN